METKVSQVMNLLKESNMLELLNINSGLISTNEEVDDLNILQVEISKRVGLIGVSVKHTDPDNGKSDSSIIKIIDSSDSYSVGYSEEEFGKVIFITNIFKGYSEVFHLGDCLTEFGVREVLIDKLYFRIKGGAYISVTEDDDDSLIVEFSRQNFTPRASYKVTNAKEVLNLIKTVICREEESKLENEIENLYFSSETFESGNIEKTNWTKTMILNSYRDFVDNLVDLNVENPDYYRIIGYTNRYKVSYREDPNSRGTFWVTSNNPSSSNDKDWYSIVRTKAFNWCRFDGAIFVNDMIKSETYRVKDNKVTKLVEENIIQLKDDFILKLYAYEEGIPTGIEIYDREGRIIKKFTEEIVDGLDRLKQLELFLKMFLGLKMSINRKG